MAPEARPLDLAGAVADGEETDWDATEDSALEAQRPLIQALRQIALVSQAHRRLDNRWPEIESIREDAVRQRWGHLELLERVGKGSYGEVYRAVDPRLDRHVALKLLWPSRLAVGELVREGRLLARVKHPNVASVFGADSHGGRVGIWMEFIAGRDLGEYLREHGPLGAHEAAALGIPICRALAAAHSCGIIHRDVKASNVMREEGGRIVLTDFGVGQEGPLESDHRGTVVGTPLYLAPEVLAGEPATRQSDLYSLGVLFFLMLTGEFPVRRESLAELHEAHRSRERQLLRDCRPELPGKFVGVIERALAYEPSARFETAGELELALARSVDKTFSRQKPARPRRRWQWALAAVALLVLVVVVGLRGFQRREALSRFEDAERAYEVGDVHEAIRLLETATKLHPGFGLAWARLATYAGGGEGKYGQAFEASGQAYRRRRSLSELDRYYVEGTYHLYRLQYRAALPFFESIVALRQEDATTHRQLAHIHRNLGQYPDAIEALRRASAVEPDSVINRGFLAVLLAESGKPEEALRQIEATRAAFEPQGRDVRYLHWGEGFAAVALGDLERAEAAFRALIEAGEAYTRVGRLFLAQNLILAGEWEAARLELDRDPAHYVEAPRENSTRLYRLARTNLLLGRQSDALAQLRLMIAITHAEPEDGSLPFLPAYLRHIRDAALMYTELGYVKEARRLEADIRNVAEIYPSALSNSAQAQVQGALLAAAGKRETARRKFDEARQQWNDPSLMRSVSHFWLDQDNCVEALPHLEQILDAEIRIFDDHFIGTVTEAQKHVSNCLTGPKPTVDLPSIPL